MSDAPLPLHLYPHRRAIPTRRRDNDVHGHVNNIEYYAYFDTVINAYLSAREHEPLATGWFVHVFVDRANRRPVAIIPDTLRGALAALG